MLVPESRPPPTAHHDWEDYRKYRIWANPNYCEICLQTRTKLAETMFLEWLYE